MDNPSDRAPSPLSSSIDLNKITQAHLEATRQGAVRLNALLAQARGRDDLAWWPDPVEPDACSTDDIVFFRPRQLLVRTEYFPVVLSALRKHDIPIESADGVKAPGVLGLKVTGRAPAVPDILATLRCDGLGAGIVAPNYVMFGAPGATLKGTPWFSGGGDDTPVEIKPPTDPTIQQGSSAQVAVFDNGLMDGYQKLHNTWYENVHPYPAVQTIGTHDLWVNHGVFVAGILAYTANQANVVVCDVLNDLGDVDDGQLAATVDAFLNAHTDIHLVNLSLGGLALSSNPPLSLPTVIQTNHPNVVFVASAGNTSSPNGGPDFFPAALSGVVGVGALDATGQPAAFSNGPKSAKVWARGVDVVSGFCPYQLQLPSGNTTYASGRAKWSGTSFATPRVTGVLTGYIAYCAANGIAPTGAGALAWLQLQFPGARTIVP